MATTYWPSVSTPFTYRSPVGAGNGTDRYEPESSTRVGASVGSGVGEVPIAVTLAAEVGAEGCAPCGVTGVFTSTITMTTIAVVSIATLAVSARYGIAQPR